MFYIISRKKDVREPLCETLPLNSIALNSIPQKMIREKSVYSKI